MRRWSLLAAVHRWIAPKVSAPGLPVLKNRSLNCRVFSKFKENTAYLYRANDSRYRFETTIAAVITEAKTHHKASINDLSLMPKYAILDPELTVGLPPKTTATTGMDALCHAVEAYTNNTYNSKLEKDLSKKATKLIYDNLYKVYLNPKDIVGRQNLQRAAFCAGRAFTRGSVGYVHAIGHTFRRTSLWYPHGLAMSILLPHVMKAYGEKKAYDRLSNYVMSGGIKADSDTKEAKAKAFIAWIEDLKVKMDIPLYPEYKDEDVDQIGGMGL